MSGAYYNENDAKAAAWLRELIKAGLIAPGEVDERSIEDVTPADLTGFRQCHFFAGIGGWSYALRLAGWPDDRPVWTGSCPCQPFSAAGARKGSDDERHLWPHFRWLIDQRRPPIVFGEQVASKDGRHWLAGVRTDLETLGYQCGAADLCAAGVGAPHIRQRLWWVANPASQRPQGHGAKRGLGESGSEIETARSCSDGGLGDPVRPGLPAGPDEQARLAASDLWSGATIIACGDGEHRRIESGLEPLVDGLPGRVGLLRGYGNAIVPQVGAEFVAAYMEAVA